MKNAMITLLIASVSVAACGGGGTETVAGIDARGNPVAVVSQGTITGFGSIIVNGVRYDTNGTSFEIDGAIGTEADLAVGDVVIVIGTLNAGATTGTANSVFFDDVVEGPISAIDDAANTITVLEQLIYIDADTSFDDNISPASIAGLALNDVVEVSGLFRADGSVSATRIEKKPAGGDFEVTGLVSNLSGTTFMINALLVDFSAAQLDDFPAGAPENGQRVEAKGMSLGAMGQLLASRVEFKGNDLGGEDGDRLEIEGFITRFVSAADFDVEGIPVTTNGSTAFENGTAADLALNRKVEVEGDMDANGTIVATKIEIKLANFIRVEGLVDAVDAQSVTIFGIAIGADASTRFEDKSSVDLKSFGLGDINVGDYLETRGFENASGVVATRIEREDFDNEVAIRAFVDSVSDPSFSVRGVSVQTNGNTVFRDINEQLISASAFYAQASGRLVEAKGSPSNGGILADEVEFED